MHASHVLSGLVALLPFAAAVPPYSRHAARGDHGKRIAFKENAQFEFQPFVLTELGMECDRETDDDMFSCEIRFDWHDPNSVRQNNASSCTCTSEWSWDGVTSESGENNTYADEFVRCLQVLPGYFQMRFSSFDTAENFTLELAHHYRDSENFTEPYVYPTTWASQALQLPVIKSEENTIQLYDAGPVHAEVIGISN